MKKVTFLVVLIVAISTGLFFGMPEKAKCSNGDCPIGEDCFGDLECNQLNCNLRCAKINKLGTEKKCVLKY